MTTTTPKKRTITLTGRAPVTIHEDRWPVVAKAHGDSWGTSGDGARHDQALSQGELDRYHLLVRQHSDGRAIVYAIVDGAGAWTGTEDRRGGELLEPGDDLAAAIQRVGEDVGIPEGLIRECVADLPAEELDDRTPAEYAADCIPEGTPRQDIVAEGETPEIVADALLQTHPPQGLDPTECRQALLDRIEYLLS